MKPLVIFGAGDIAEVAHFYWKNDTKREIVAFTVDREFLPEGKTDIAGMPIIAFEEIVERFPPHDCDMFVAMSYSRLNTIRQKKCDAAMALGYKLATYVSSRATIWPGFDPGWNCFILEDNTIQPFVKIGNNVTLWSGNHIGHHSTIHDNVFIASHVVISGGVEVEENCFVGVNVTMRDHIKIGANSVLGAGALILENVEPNGVYPMRSSERSPVPSNRLRGI